MLDIKSDTDEAMKFVSIEFLDTWAVILMLKLLFIWEHVVLFEVELFAEFVGEVVDWLFVGAGIKEHELELNVYPELQAVQIATFVAWKTCQLETVRLEIMIVISLLTAPVTPLIVELMWKG